MENDEEKRLDDRYFRERPNFLEKENGKWAMVIGDETIVFADSLLAALKLATQKALVLKTRPYVAHVGYEGEEEENDLPLF
jgi:hypothetical protein